jgi:hypothetical protein
MPAVAWEPIVGVAFGVGSIVLGIASTRGSFRRSEPWYRDPEMPWFLRNGGFALIPFGIAILALIAAAVTSDEKAVSAVCVVVFVVGLLGGLVFMIRPPEWVKPDWVRREESTGR